MEFLFHREIRNWKIERFKVGSSFSASRIRRHVKLRKYFIISGSRVIFLSLHDWKPRTFQRLKINTSLKHARQTTLELKR